MDNKRNLSSTYYNRVRKNCSPQWNEFEKFQKWYYTQLTVQENVCHYCHLPGDTKEKYDKWFRKDRRGRNLEVDRVNNDKPYSPKNCVLACYPCNNAKSDVFTHDEFIEIGNIIRHVKSQRNVLV